MLPPAPPNPVSEPIDPSALVLDSDWAAVHHRPRADEPHCGALVGFLRIAAVIAAERFEPAHFRLPNGVPPVPGTPALCPRCGAPIGPEILRVARRLRRSATIRP